MVPAIPASSRLSPRLLDALHHAGPRVTETARQDQTVSHSPGQPHEVRSQTGYLRLQSTEAAAAIKLTAADPPAQPATCDLLVWPARLIQASALVIILFELACLLGEAAANRTDFAVSLPVRAACLLFGTLLLAASFQPRLRQRWQVFAFIITSAVVALTTILGIARETADQFFVDLLVLSLGASSPLPWTFAWQAAANGLMLSSLAAFAAFAPGHDPFLYTHWVGLVAGAGVVQVCSNYAGRYRQEIARDITELKRSQLQLIEAREAALAASRAKSEFLSSMSHEIRTPMNAVLGMADVLAETDLNSEQDRYLNTIINNGTALLELINRILDLDKVESGRVSLESVEFSPREIVEQVLETLAVRAHKKRLELVAQIASTVPELVLGDPWRLLQILINLAGNAVKFTERGHVLINLEIESGAVGVLLKFEVRDSGIGIPAEKIDGLFQPFSQADSSTSRRYGGSGLGLAIVARLVALMGGEIAVESLPGAGSVFWFSARFARPDEPASQGAPLLDLSNKRILVVDDSEANCEAMRLLLSERGAAVTVEHSGSRALELIGRMARLSTPFDAILIDNCMLDTEGHQVVHQAIAAGHSRAFIVMISASDGGETNQLEAAGINNHVVKPVKRSELLAAVSGAIAMRTAEPELAVNRPKDASLEHPSSAPGDHGLHILFADDLPDNRALIKAYMKNAPHLIDFAENGEEAIGKFAVGRYDLVFMDIEMPIVDGYAAVQEIRRRENRTGRVPTPIVALTASADAEAVRRANEVGCNLHLSKPLKKQALLDTISRYVPERGALVALSDGHEVE